MKKFLSFLMVISIVFSLCSFSAIAEETLIYSENFENGITADWTYWTEPSKENLKISEEAYSEGGKSVHFYDGADNTSYGIKSQFIDVTEGETYTLLTDIYCYSGTITMYFKYFDGNSKQIFAKSAKGTKGQWSAVKITEVAPEGAVKCQIDLCGNSGSLGEGYFDNVRVYKGDVTKEVSKTAKAPSKSFGPVVEYEDIYKVGDVIFEETFEDGISSIWSKGGKILVEVSENVVKDGKKSLYINDSSETDSGGLNSIRFPATENEFYCVIADMNNEFGSVSIYIKFFDSEGNALQNTSRGVVALNRWEVNTFNAKAPEGTVSMQVRIYTASTSKRAGYVDNVKLVKGLVKHVEPEPEYIEPKQTPAVNAEIVAPVDNKLVYKEFTDKGDKLADYSYGGFYAGEYELPDIRNLPVVLTLSPSGTDDDTKMIQDAIDKVYNDYPDTGMKVIKLKAGKYNLNQTGIRLKSNIILLGEGQGPTGTILFAKDPVNHFVVRIEGTEPVKVGEDYYITDDYIPAGSKTFNISEEAIKNFRVGDLITIYHPSSEEWCAAMEMKGIINSGGTDSSWYDGAANMKTERVITAINGTEITVDFGLFVPYDKSLVKSYIYKTDESGRIENAGIENLRIESTYNGDTNDENHATVAIAVTNAKNVYARNVSAKYFYSSIITGRSNAKQVTAVNCSNLQPASRITGSRRYSFAASRDSQQLLYTGCYSYDGRHDFIASFPATGPISYVDNTIDKSNTSSETHGTWSTGVLYDNLYQIGHATPGFFAFANRGNYGTSISQGWTSASCVMWNCLATTFIAHKPPLTYQNFVVGSFGLYNDPDSQKMKEANAKSYRGVFETSKGLSQDSNFVTKEGSPFVGDSYVENEFTPVEPRSLYKAQLAERFTGDIRNARPNAPVLVYPRSDREFKENKISVSGAYQLGAEAVTVYIDNVPYKADMKADDCSFEWIQELSEGVHKIYATQTINGVEGCKTADRFITIGEAKGNPDYLQSIYPPEATRMIINDPRPTYDQVENALKGKITVTVDGSRLISDVDPYETQGRVLVPMRAIFETLDATVTWDEATATATAVKGDITVKITENQKTTYVNGNPYELDVPATITNGRFVVPVRFISESFGATVYWIDSTLTVVIKSK